ncbi:hypothetical protein CHARACLAT_009233 [Characodon lateralis]|uniref:Uncharacterized protein n=1 Tax=Characodon lateralis TaxID=208331 RepID=A0ABU7DZY1_9TELE|nr:hypothetical protein [Characodon lateralis]
MKPSKESGLRTVIHQQQLALHGEGVSWYQATLDQRKKQMIQKNSKHLLPDSTSITLLHPACSCFCIFVRR